MAELAFHFILEAIKTLLLEPITEADISHAREDILEPMLPSNYQSTSQSCLFQDRFSQIIMESQVSYVLPKQ